MRPDTAAILAVTEGTFAAEVVEASHGRPVVVDFWAAWCGPCVQLAPLLERAAARHAGDIDVRKLDIDAAPGLARQLRIQGIPAVKAFRDGRIVAEFTGLQAEPVIERFFAALAPSEADRLVTKAGAADGEAREALLREALALQLDHPAASLALAEILADRGEVDEAATLLERLPGDADAQRLLAGMRLASDRRDDAALADLRARSEVEPAARLELGRGLAAAGAHGEALEVLVAAARDRGTRDEARAATLAVFQVLGEGHELVRVWRPRLTAALF